MCVCLGKFVCVFVCLCVCVLSVHTYNHSMHSTQSTCMHMYIHIANFAQAIRVVVVTLFGYQLSSMDDQMHDQDSSSDEKYEEVEDVVSQICGKSFGRKIHKLRSYRTKAKTSMKLVHHWKDKCMATRAELSQLDDAYKSQSAKLMELQAEHEKVGKWLSLSSDQNQGLEELGLKVSQLKRHNLMSQEDEFFDEPSSSMMQSELSDEPQFKMSKVGATFSAHPSQPKDPAPAHVFPIGATLPKTTK